MPYHSPQARKGAMMSVTAKATVFKRRDTSVMTGWPTRVVRLKEDETPHDQSLHLAHICECDADDQARKDVLSFWLPEKSLREHYEPVEV
ncbi:MAG: hypothetical protein PHV78_03660 [Patescibacteria group bacterium]|nr:hypothetical protein [Patescibacteria group bacterium]MDD5121516.1 hypothetical protein [Patescibacteria group bacterium]MDD5221846.1 hypothetical protein [Patescibacteria group bacterium]MDD5396321.1 hypothetical protein [Patescibacteria group bacterium]